MFLFSSVELIIFLFVLLTFCSCVANSDLARSSSNSCQTPDKKYGACIKIQLCPPLLGMLIKERPRPSTRTIDFLRKSHCGFEGKDPVVCCPFQDYFDQTLETRNYANLTEHPNADLLPKSCGIIYEDRILGGSVTARDEFPWMALIGYKSRNNASLQYKCGGTLINRRYVLTAAHCIKDYMDAVFSVRLGEHNLTKELDCRSKNCSTPVRNYKIEEAILHPEYFKAKLSNDIALLRLEEDVKTTAAISPICLPVSKEQRERSLNGEKVVITGWGTAESGLPSSVLRKVRLPVIPLRNCTDAYKNIIPVTEKQICAGGENGRDSCTGDSGGPMQYVGRISDYEYGYIQYGVVSFGPRACGTLGQPGVYTKVPFYMEWILNTIRP